MKLKVKMIIMSQLSDVQETVGDYHPTILSNNRQKLNFAKYLLMKYPDTNVEVDADLEYEEFKKKHPNL